MGPKGGPKRGPKMTQKGSKMTPFWPPQKGLPTWWNAWFNEISALKWDLGPSWDPIWDPLWDPLWDPNRQKWTPNPLISRPKHPNRGSKMTLLGPDLGPPTHKVFSKNNEKMDPRRGSETPSGGPKWPIFDPFLDPKSLENTLVRWFQKGSKMGHLGVPDPLRDPKWVIFGHPQNDPFWPKSTKIHY